MIAARTMETRDSRPCDVPETELRALARRLDGRLLEPGDAGYDDARRVWNGMIDRLPAAIVRCASAGDAWEALAFARRHDLLVSIRGGGHNVAGHAVCDGGLMIDLSRMRKVVVDARAGTATVEPGCTWRDVDAACQAHGLATTGGVVSHTGVAGLTLGGGLGHLMGRHGLTCDNVRRLDIVLADGSKVTTSADDEPNLFWALRGAGANFGLVTSFVLQLHPLGPEVYGGVCVWPVERADEALATYRAGCAAAPDDLALTYGISADPDGSPVASISVGWFGDVAEGPDVVALLRAAAPEFDGVRPMPYQVLQSMFDDAVPHGLRRYWKSGFLDHLDDEVIAALTSRATAMPTPLSQVVAFHLHGAATRPAHDATAFSHRQEGWDVNVLAQWSDPADTARCSAWVREVWSQIAPSSPASYVNHMDHDEPPARVRAAYGDNWHRLAHLKRRYDPDNVFHMNQNIPPNGP